MGFKELKQKTLEKRLADLFEKYQAASDQFLTELNAVNRQTIQNQITQLEQQAAAVEAELRALEAEHRPAERQTADIQTHLPQIDFQEALHLFRQTLARFDHTGGAAVFLVQQSTALGGEWFLQHVKGCLAERTRNFKTYTIEFSVEASPNEFSLMQRLAGCLGIPAQAASWEQTASQVLDTLCASVRTGDVVLLEFHRWDQLAGQAHVLSVFLRHFWTPLVNRLGARLQEWERVKVIAFLTAGGPLAPQCRSAELFCTPDRFCPDKVLEIPLRPWTCQEIQQWLYDFSRLKTQQIPHLAQYIYAASQQGIPRVVYSELVNSLETC